MKIGTNIISRIISFVLTAAIFSAFIPVKEIKAAENFNIYTYIADNYLSSNTPAGRCINFYRNEFETSAEILSGAMSDDFIASVNAWEAANLALSPEQLASKGMDARGYYMTVILTMLQCTYTNNNDVLKALESANDVKNEVKLYNAFASYYKKATAMDLDVFLEKSSYTAEEKAQLKTVQQEWLKENKFIATGNAMSSIFDVLGAIDSAAECVESYISYCMLAQMSNEWKECIKYMYSICDKSNEPLAMALETLASASEGDENETIWFNALCAVWKDSMGKFGADLYSYATGKLIETLVSDIPVLNAVYAGCKIGQVIGTTMSNMIFNTDKIIRQYYILNSYCIVKGLFEQAYAVKGVGEYRSNPTPENARKYISYVNMMFTVYSAGMDFGQQYVDAVYSGGIVNNLFSSKEQYQQFTETNSEMLNLLNNAFDSLTVCWMSDLYGDNREMYEYYAPLINFSGTNAYVFVTKVAFEKDSVEYGLDDLLFVAPSYTVYPENASNKNVYFTSTDKSVAEINNYGVITVHKEGVCQFVVTSAENDGTIYDTITVNVVPGHGSDSAGFDEVTPIEPTSPDTDDFEYTIENGEVAITGYTGRYPNVIIPNRINGYPVTSIGYGAFESCTSLTSITIPNSVTSIGYGAFESCTSLTSITIPNSVIYISYYAFAHCTSLTSVTIPDRVTSIDDCAFESCTSLTSVTIPNSVGAIGGGTFRSCTNLTSITIPNSVTSIGYEAFYNCTSLTSVTIPDRVTSIDDCAFYNCTNLTSITIPNSVTYIGDCAFYNCTSLTSVTIPDRVTSIGDCAFYNCTSLTSVTIPDRVTFIWDGAFAYCTKLTSVIIPQSVTYIDRVAFCNCPNITIWGYSGSYAETYAKNKNIPFECILDFTSVIPQDSSVSLEWSNVNNAVKYVLYCTLDGKNILVKELKTTRYTVTGLSNGKEYGFTVLAYTDNDIIPHSSTEEIFATPVGNLKPKITKTIPGDGQVGLNWSSVSGATQYAVYYRTGSTWTLAGKRTETGMYVKGLTNGTKYGFAVKAYVNGAWTGITSSDIVYATPATIATKPKITKTIPGNGQVGLNWSQVSGATQYAVYYKTGSTWTLAGKTTALGMYVRGLANGTKYGFAVKAYVNRAWTGITSSDIVYASPTAPVTKPVITKTIVGDGQVGLNWSSVSGATQYAVYYKTGSTWTLAGKTTALGMYVRGLANGTKYGFAVKAYVNRAWTTITSSDIVYALPTAPVTKPVITKTIVGDGQVGLNWTSVSGAKQYAVYYRTGSTWTLAGKRTETGMYVKGLTNGTKYGFAVKAYVNGAWTTITSSDIVYATPTAAKSSIIDIDPEDIEFFNAVPVIA